MLTFAVNIADHMSQLSFKIWEVKQLVHELDHICSQPHIGSIITACCLRRNVQAACVPIDVEGVLPLTCALL